MKHIEDDELERRVDEVLYYIWDPIGVNQEIWARGEYRGYVARVLKMLEGGASERALADYLRGVEVSNMSLSSRRTMKQANLAAKALLEHKQALDEGAA